MFFGILNEKSTFYNLYVKRDDLEVSIHRDIDKIKETIDNCKIEEKKKAYKALLGELEDLLDDVKYNCKGKDDINKYRNKKINLYNKFGDIRKKVYRHDKDLGVKDNNKIIKGGYYSFE